MNDRELTAEDVNRVIEMAWEDRTPFDAIDFQFGLKEDDVKELMKRNLKLSSYKLWRKRVGTLKTKHVATRPSGMTVFKSNLQRIITRNKFSKRS